MLGAKGEKGQVWFEHWDSGINMCSNRCGATYSLTC